MEAIKETSCKSSVATVTTDREAHPKHWYVAQVKMHCERSIAKKLQGLGYETFVPVQREIHQWSDRKKKVERVIIPLMVFVRIKKSDLLKIERLSYVYSFLRSPGDKEAAIIPDYQLERFKFMIGNCDSKISIDPVDINKGDNVRVTRGSLKGLEGIVTETSEGQSRVSILLDCIGYASVLIDKEDLEKVK